MMSKLLTILKHIVLLLFLVMVLGPFLWLVGTAFKDFGDVFTYPPRVFPKDIRWANFSEVFNSFPMIRLLLNSIIVTIGRTLGILITSSMAAYAFARLKFPGRNKVFLLYLLTLMVPFQVVMIPLFIIMKYLGWVDSYQALIFPGMFNALGVFLLRQFFLTLPRSLEESAFIDGASYWTIFTRIILPLAKPGLATLSVLSFLWSWNDFLWPLIVIDSMEMNTITLGIAKFQGYYYTEWNLLMAATVIALIPTIIIYMLAQKYFVEGIATSGAKY